MYQVRWVPTGWILLTSRSEDWNKWRRRLTDADPGDRPCLANRFAGNTALFAPPSSSATLAAMDNSIYKTRYYPPPTDLQLTGLIRVG